MHFVLNPLRVLSALERAFSEPTRREGETVWSYGSPLHGLVCRERGACEEITLAGILDSCPLHPHASAEVSQIGSLWS